MGVGRGRVSSVLGGLKPCSRCFGDEGFQRIRQQPEPLLKAQREYIAQMRVGFHMQLAQQRLGTFVHGVAQGRCQGGQCAGAEELRRVSRPKAPIGDTDSLVTHESFETNRSCRQFVNTFALGRQHNAADQAEGHRILGVARRHTAHNERAHSAR